MLKTSLISHLSISATEIGEKISFTPYLSLMISSMLGKKQTVYDRLFFNVNRRINGNLYAVLDRKYIKE